MLRAFSPRLRVLLLLGIAAALPLPVRADPSRFGVRLGLYSDAGKPFFGVEGLLRVEKRTYFNPNVEVVLVDNGSYLTLNGDFHWDLTPRRHYLWLGLGPALVWINPRGPGNATTDLGLNLFGGVGFRSGSLLPYMQIKVIVKESSEVSLAAGVRF